MPLVHCRACGKQISDVAPACPQCGEPQNLKKSKSNNAVWILLPVLVIVIGAVLYFGMDMFSGKHPEIIIPEGAYVLEKTPEKGVAKFLESVSTNLKGVGTHLTISGDTVVESTGAISNLVANVEGSTTRFKLSKSGTNNQFWLSVGNEQVPLELSDTKEVKITINNTVLIYQKQ